MSPIKRYNKWYTNCRIHGEKVRIFAGFQKQQALVLEAKLKTEALEGKHGILTKEVPFLALLEEFKKDKFLDYTPKTIRSYNKKLSYFAEFIIKQKITQIHQITPSIIDKYKNSRKINMKTGEPNTNATINNDITFLKTFFDYCIKNKYCYTNPVLHSGYLKRTKNPRVIFFEAKEVKNIIEKANSDLKPILITFLNTGMRLGEVCNLKWKDIDYKNKKLLIREPKNKKNHYLDINDKLLKTLKSLPKETEYVFVNSNNNPYKENKLGDKIRAFGKRNEIENLTPHVLRHTFVSLLAKNGYSLDMICKIVNHRSATITNIYYHCCPEELRDAMQSLNGLF